MKTRHRLLQSLSFIFALLMLLACSEDTYTAKRYVGDWEMTMEYPSSAGFASFEHQLELRSDEYREGFTLTDGLEMIYVYCQGDLTANNLSIWFTLKRVSYCNYDPLTGAISEPFEVLQANELTEQDSHGWISNHRVRYSRDGDVLTIVFDHNNDGTDSEFVYTRVVEEEETTEP